MKKKIKLLSIVLLIFICSGCEGINKDSMDDITVYTSLYPIQYTTEILYKGKVRRAYKWDEMRTHRIVYMGKGTLRNSEDFWCDVKACVVFSTRRIKDSFFQSPFPFEAWNEQISGVCLLFPGVAMLVAMAVWFFRKRRVVKIYLDNRESFSKDNIYYSSVNKKYFLQSFLWWHNEGRFGPAKRSII